jgi:hypothetical protein
MDTATKNEVKPENDFGVCRLCGQGDRDKASDHTRTIWLNRDKTKLDPGFFCPRLTIDEKYYLRDGENTICSNRRKCAERQRAKAEGR